MKNQFSFQLKDNKKKEEAKKDDKKADAPKADAPAPAAGGGGDAPKADGNQIIQTIFLFSQYGQLVIPLFLPIAPAPAAKADAPGNLS